MQPIVPNDYSPEVLALIPPFPKSGKALYRLLLETGGVMDAINERNEVIPKQRVNGNPTSLTAQAVIYDPHKGQNVTINVSRSQTVQGQGANQYLAPVLEYVTFNRLGEVELTAAQQPMYRFLELHPGNKSNVLTGVGSGNLSMPENGWRFQRIEPDKTARELAEQQRLTDKVRGIIGQNTAAENRAIATRLPAHLKFDANVSEDMLYSQLRAAAEKDPDAVFRATTDEAGKLDALVSEAITHKVIEFDHVERTWLRSGSRQKLTAVPTGEPKDGLIAWLLDTQGATARNWLKGAVADVAKQPAAKAKEAAGPVPDGMKRGPFGRLVPIDQDEAADQA